MYAIQGPKAVEVLQRLVPDYNFKAMAFGVSEFMSIKVLAKSHFLSAYFYLLDPR